MKVSTLRKLRWFGGGLARLWHALVRMVVITAMAAGVLVAVALLFNVDEHTAGQEKVAAIVRIWFYSKSENDLLKAVCGTIDAVQSSDRRP